MIIHKHAPNRNQYQYQDDIDDISQTSDDDPTKEVDDHGASSSRTAGRSWTTGDNREGAGMPPTVDLESLVLAQLTTARHDVSYLFSLNRSSLTALATKLARSMGLEAHEILLDETLQSIARLCPTGRLQLSTTIGD